MDEVEHEGHANPEVQLGIYASALAQAVETGLSGWVRRCIEDIAAAQRLPVEAAEVAEAAERARAEVSAAVAELLATDVDEQRTTPLAILRAAVSYPTDVLVRYGAMPVERDDFARRAFPADIFDLSPANFADIDPDLAEPGIAWGAAKAFVHRRRRMGDGSP